MVLHILVGQRKYSYPGEYLPEALAVVDANWNDDNPDYMREEKLKYEKSNEFNALAIVRIFVADVDINAALYPNNAAIDGVVVN